MDIQAMLEGRKSLYSEPLVDPKNEIRLMFLCPGKDDEVIRLRVEIYKLNEAPAFRAISYVWGEATTQREIYIDDQHYSVRYNCFYAIWQVRTRFPGSYIWIDALSIYQSDLEERSAQVQIMVDIYSSASAVLSCVGPEGEDTKFLREAVVGLGREGYISAVALATNGYTRPGSIREAMLRRGSDYCRRYAQAFSEFSKRSYWSRLWIVQELAAAKSTIIMCGKSGLSWTSLKLVTSMWSECGAILEKMQKSGDIVQLDHGTSLKSVVDDMWANIGTGSFGGTILAFGGLHCQDPRDHIYALLGLIKPAAYSGLFVDYSISSFELAVQTAPYMGRFGSFLPVLSCLKVDMNDPDLNAIVTSRRHAKPVLHESLPLPDKRPEAPPWEQLYLLYSIIGRNADGSLACPWRLIDPQRSRSKRETIVRWLDKHVARRALRDRMPQRLVVGKETVGLTCPETAPGDLLMLLEDLASGICLVLRPRGEGLFQVIGQAILLELDVTKDLQPFESSIHRAHFQTSLSVKDWLILLGQDFIEDGTLYPTNWLKPPKTSIVERVKRPVTLPTDMQSSSGAFAWKQDARE